jgi:FkbM family methyltransferase
MQHSTRRRFKHAWNHYLPFPWFPLPVRLPFGGIWLAWNDIVGDLVFAKEFELAEVALLSRLLLPGMTAIDIGAHHGYFTLLMSRQVRPHGRVIAFEPSPKERRRLRLHITLNRCANVQVEPYALGSATGTLLLHVVWGRASGSHSLRPPNVAEYTTPVGVSVCTLDDYLSRHAIREIDFVKLDAEGAEMDIFLGARTLLTRRPRPVIMAEVGDLQTRPWGHVGRDVIEFLERLGYAWFGFACDGSLHEIQSDETYSEDSHVAVNLIAVPSERSHFLP